MQSHPHQIVSISFVASSSSFWTFGSAILRKTNALRRLCHTVADDFKKDRLSQTWGFEDRMDPNIH